MRNGRRLAEWSDAVGGLLILLLLVWVLSGLGVLADALGAVLALAYIAVGLVLIWSFALYLNSSRLRGLPRHSLSPLWRLAGGAVLSLLIASPAAAASDAIGGIVAVPLYVLSMVAGFVFLVSSAMFLLTSAYTFVWYPFFGSEGDEAEDDEDAMLVAEPDRSPAHDAAGSPPRGYRVPLHAPPRIFHNWPGTKRGEWPDESAANEVPPLPLPREYGPREDA